MDDCKPKTKELISTLSIYDYKVPDRILEEFRQALVKSAEQRLPNGPSYDRHG